MNPVETGLFYLNSRYYDPETGRFINADAPEMLGLSVNNVLGTNLFVYGDNNPVMNIDPSGYFSIPRALVSLAIDGFIWAVFSPAAIGWAAAMQPIKAMAKIWGKELMKRNLGNALSGFSKTLAQAIIKIATKLVPIIKKAVGWLFRSWASKLTAKSLAVKIAGGLASLLSNEFLNGVASNLPIFLSVGGLVGGLWDYFSDRKMNGWIKLW